ncbi:collagen alpha-1(I) chain-like [Lontra canadensis]|uniref:collagen alpha-1(I) chain-like n=1 Tax=Lontra canadensis TaxID=76717 RepID=UPI0013F31D36|nr:collagen alpha-1(I) chain-like [Lontra canadensis]
MHGLIFETSICYWQDQPGRSAVSQRQPAPPRRGAAQGLPVGRTCRARGGTRGGGGGGGNPPTERRSPRGAGEREDAPHSPRPNPHPQRRARLTARAPPPRTRAHRRRRREARDDPTPHTPGRPRWRRAGGAGAPVGHAGAGAGQRALPQSKGKPGRNPTPPPPPAEAARGRNGHGGRPGPDPRPGTRAGAGGARRRAGRSRPPSAHDTTAGPAAADTDGRPQRAGEAPAHRGAAPGRQADGGGGEAARQRLRGKGRGRQKPEQPRGKRTAGRREGAQELLKRRLPRPEVGRRGTRGPTAQGLQHKGGPVAPEDTDPGPSGPWPPRGARAPGHHATVTTDTQRDALPRARRHPSVPHSNGPAQTPPSHPGPRPLRPGTTPPQGPLEAWEGTTPNSGEAGFGPEEADQGHSAPSPVQASQGQGKRARDPTATSTRAVPRRPGTPAGLSTLGAPPHREPGPTPLGPNPTGAPPQGARLNPQPVRLVRPGTTTRGKRPQARAARPVPTRHRRRRLGPGAGTADSRSHGTGQEMHDREGVAARALARTREPHAPDAGQARRDPPPTGRGEAQAAVGKRATLGPTAGPADPSRRGGSAQHATVAVATTRRGGAAAGGSGTPRHPLGSLEKAFSPRAHRPHPFVPPTEPRERASQRPPRAWGQGWVRGKGQAQGNPERARPGPDKGAAFASPHRPCSHHRPEGTSCLHRGHERSGDGHGMLGKKSSSPRLAKRHSAGSARRGRSHTPPSPVHTHPPARRAPGDDEAPAPPQRGAGWASLTGSTTRSSDMPLTAAAQRGRWERETTPPLGLRHLRQPGALQGHHRGPGATHSARPGGEQRGMGTALPASGRAARPAGSQERQARVSAASEDPTPMGALRREPWKSGARPRRTRHHHIDQQKACPRGPQGGKRLARTPTRRTCFRPRQHPSDPGQEQPGNPGRTPDTWHRALRNGTGVTTAAAGCLQRRAHGVKDPRHLPTQPSGAGDRRWHHSPGHLGGTRAGAQAHADGSNERGPSRIWHHGQARSPARTQKPTSPRRVTPTACQHLPGNKKCSFQGTK